jgi:hypothetical protein
MLHTPYGTSRIEMPVHVGNELGKEVGEYRIGTEVVLDDALRGDDVDLVIRTYAPSHPLPLPHVPLEVPYLPKRVARLLDACLRSHPKAAPERRSSCVSFGMRSNPRSRSS